MQRKISNIKYKLHSIPILLNMKNKSNVLYSIPCVKSCACTFCILLALGFLSIVAGSNSCYAVASTSLTIDGDSSKTVSETIAPNETKYVSSNVSYSATDTSAYTLKLTYANGSSALALDNGSSSDGSSGGSSGTSDSSTTTIPDVANNTTGSSIKNAWGYSWTSTDNTNYEGIAYNAIPAYGSSTNIETGTTISSTTKQLVFAANLSDSNPTGHYKTNLLLSLVATPATTTYTITYNANGGTGAPSSTTCTAQGVSGTNCTTTLSSTKPTRTNYTFLGWSTSSSAATASYSAGGSITISSDTMLYAVWKDGRTIGNITYMQDMNSDICANTATGTTYTLKDSRDNNSYTVRKFNDGRCWMTSNLRITGTIRADQSDFSSPSTLTIPNEASGFDQANQYTLKGYDSGVNGYYNWYTITAQTGNSSITSKNTPVDASICPKGWKLPTSGDNGELKKFTTAENIAGGSTGAATLRGEPYNFTYAGYVGSNSLNTSGAGYYWSNMVYSSSDAYVLHIGSYGACGDLGLLGTAASPSSSCSRYLGFTARCIAR